MLPHYPASSEWATVGGYVAARGSGVLSTRYGKIEDLVLSLRVALAGGELIDTVAVPRHAVGPELTQLFVGCEGTLGIITRATLEIVPLPPERRFLTLQFPNVDAGIEAFRRHARRRLPAVRHPHVRRGGDRAHVRAGRRRGARGRLRRRVLRGRGRPPSPWRGPAPSSSRARVGARELDPALAERWWDRRYEFYKPPHHPELPSIWGTIDVVATYTQHRRRPRGAARPPCATATPADGLQLRMHFSHWYRWGTMIYARFLIPDGGDDALTLHDQIWEDGITAVLAAGGVMNDHHGVGLKLAPYMAAQHGPALDTLAPNQERAGPARHHEPRQARSLRRDRCPRPEERDVHQGVDAQLDAAGADRAHDQAAGAAGL